MLSFRNACCSSPIAIVYWAVISFLTWCGLGTIGLLWNPLHGTSAATILSALSVGCIANWILNRTCHCYFDGPLLFGGATAFLLRQIRVIDFPSVAVWLPLGLGVAISFYLGGVSHLVGVEVQAFNASGQFRIVDHGAHLVVPFFSAVVGNFCSALDIYFGTADRGVRSLLP